MDYLQIGTKLVSGFILLFLSAKIMGRQQISQVSLFDFISAMVLGEIIGNALYDQNVSIFFVILNLALWAVMKRLVEIITLRSVRVRVWLTGKPAIVIRDGQIDVKEMRRHHIDLHQLLLMIRERQIFSLSEVQYAIFEHDGRLTVMKKPELQTPTLKDMKLPTTPAFLPFSVVIDGEILPGNLAMAGVDETWLREELRRQGYPNSKQVLYAEMVGEKQLYVPKS